MADRRREEVRRSHDERRDQRRLRDRSLIARPGYIKSESISEEQENEETKRREEKTRRGRKMEKFRSMRHATVKKSCRGNLRKIASDTIMLAKITRNRFNVLRVPGFRVVCRRALLLFCPFFLRFPNGSIATTR